MGSPRQATGLLNAHMIWKVRAAIANTRPDPAGPGGQEALLAEVPGCFFVPAYVGHMGYMGHKGWMGAWLDVGQDWDEIAELIEDSYRMAAPKRLAALAGSSRDMNRPGHARMAIKI